MALMVSVSVIAITIYYYILGFGTQVNMFLILESLIGKSDSRIFSKEELHSKSRDGFGLKGVNQYFWDLHNKFWA